MSNVFAMVEGKFGKVEVIELCHSLVPHSHSEIQLSFWLAGGQCVGMVGDQTVSCGPNQAIGINSYQAHHVMLSRADEPVTLLTLYLTESWFDQHFANQFGPVSFKTAQLTQSIGMKAKCWDLMQKILFASIKDATRIEEDVRMLLQITLEGHIKTDDASVKTHRRKMLDFRLRQALRYMHDNMTQVDLMKSISKTVGVSRSRLYELFKNELQTTPKLILNSVLIESAVKHMSDSQTDLSHVSRQLGFSTAANFSRFFRGHKGVTPSSYRKQNIGQFLLQASASSDESS